MNQPKTKILRFTAVLVRGQWQQDVAIAVDDQGIITAIGPGVDELGAERVSAAALPGMVNVHSHAFQRAFAGLSEYRTSEHDSFWTWRRLMFDFLVQMQPDQIYRVAKQLYAEMLAAGYTWVGEFHYLHNDRGGVPYSHLGELSDAIIAAAQETGIGLCLLPVLYQRGGFQNEPLAEGQKRFVLNADQFVELVEYCRQAEGKHLNYNVGVAIHSLRAVEAQVANEVLTRLSSGSAVFPIHMHVAEQTGEVEECLRAHGRRSVEYLFDQFSVDPRWTLIHATHLETQEIQMIATSGAVVCLCPTTEANLGDGIFRAKEFLAAAGKIAIGSDSHISIDPREELRMLEYSQRLSRRERAILGTETESVGHRLYTQCAAGGAAAIGVRAGVIDVGYRADFTLIDTDHAAIGDVSPDRWLDRLVFCNHGNPVLGACVGGVLRMASPTN